MKLAWLTDTHLNFLKLEQRERYYQQIAATQCDAVLITGDIAEAPSVEPLLIEMESSLKKPIYFVLGNHDYYKGDIETVRKSMSALTQTETPLFWLPAAGIQPLGEHTILLGQDGWADGQLGDYVNSNLALNDSRMIADLIQAEAVGKTALLHKMQELADVDALQLQQQMSEAIAQAPKKIIILTHIPPLQRSVHA